MKYLTLLFTTVLLLLTPQLLHAYDYQDESVRFTIPEGFAVEQFRDKNISGFTAVHPTLKITLFNISGDNVSKRKCLKQDNSKWLPALKDREKLSETKPFWKRYDLTTVYNNKDNTGYIKLYRYVSAKNTGILVAESSANNWDEADAVARSQRYKKSFGFYWNNLGNYLTSFVIWAGALVGAIIFIANTVSKYRRKGYLLYALLIAAAGGALAWAEWLMPTAEYIAVTFIVLVFYAGLYGGEDAMSDGKPCRRDNDDADAPEGSDGTGTTINYDL